MIEKYLTETTPHRIVERYKALKDRAATGRFGVLDKDIVVIDTETTGISFVRDELTQIAAARMVEGKIVDWFVTFVNPGRPIPEEISHLTSIYESDVADAPSPEEAVFQLVDFVGESCLVAHNAAFDKHFCTKPATGESLTHNIWIDSLDLARIALPRLKSHRLLDLVRAFDAPLSTHRADADVEALCAVFRILLAAVDAMPQGLIDEIAAMATEEEWPTVHVFKQFASQDALGSITGDTTDSVATDGMAIPTNSVTTAKKSYFDLRALRNHTVKQEWGSPRVDAETLAADPQRGLQFASSAEIREAFSSAGPVGKIYPEFEARDEQVTMAEAVNDAFSTGKNLAVEAGTGVGKSMAYLVPAVFTAQKNGITVGVATKTNALLDQLMHHELPRLSSAVGGISYCSLKGFSHYLCLRKVERLMQTGPHMKTVQDRELSQAPALAGVLSFIEQSEYEDIDGMRVDYRLVPRYEITTTSHDCLRKKCPFYGQRCYVHGSRFKAEAADIVVTNQTLLFCDVAADGGLLPSIRYWVIDEAHNAEGEARRALGSSIELDELARRAQRVSPSSAAGQTIFDQAERKLVGKIDANEDAFASTVTADLDETTLLRDDLTLKSQNDPISSQTGLSGGDTLLFALSGKAKRAGDAFACAVDEFTQAAEGLLYFDTSSRSKSYDLVDIWINDQVRSSEVFQNLSTAGHALVDISEKLIKACQEMVGLMEDVKGAAAIQRDIASMALYLKDVINSIELIVFEGSDTFAYSVQLARKKNTYSRRSEKLDALMLNVGNELAERLYARTHSIVFTSATITIANAFDSFFTALGLSEEGERATVHLQLGSSYDFDENMKIYVVEDMPEPNDARYLAALEQLLIDIHRASAGSTLSLFTNRREMERAHSTVQAALKGDGLRVVCQKWGVSVKGLRDEFIADEHLSLFALKSFWEGFDAPGATLKTVVIPKLPFSKPTDPLSCARAQMDAQAWSHYVLPQAVIETKQAAGRLIRSAHDTGSLILADRRLVTKGYGKVFLKSMPSRNITISSAREVVAALSQDR